VPKDEGGTMRYPRFILLGLLMLAVMVAGGVVLAPWPGARATVDSDGDGYDDATEAYLGTDPLDDCPDYVGDDAWPPDLDADGDVDIWDILEMKPGLGSREGDPGFSQRRDLNADGIQGVLDYAQLTLPMYGTNCTPSPYVPPPAAGSISEVAIDTDTTGNDARLTQGADIQSCGEIDSAGTNTIEVDVVIPAPGVHADDGIETFEFLLNYDPEVVSASAEDLNFLLAQAAGSAPVGMSDSLPDTGGSWRAAVIDSGDTPEPAGDAEVGPGVLTRITLTGVAPGTTSLTLTKVGAMTAVNGVIPIDTVSNAWVAVDESCDDADGDGVPDVVDNCPAWPNADQSLPPWPVPADDPDCDGFTTTAETFMGTLPLVTCAANNGVNNEAPPDAWPFDFDDNQRAGLSDVLGYIPVFNSSYPNAPYDPRYDLDQSGGVRLPDVLSFIPVFNKVCTPP